MVVYLTKTGLRGAYGHKNSSNWEDLVISNPANLLQIFSHDKAKGRFGTGWLSLPVAFMLFSVPATHGFPAKACSRIFLCSVKSSPLALFPLVILSLLFMEFACVREN